MKYFDLHCDTATALLSRSQSLFDNNLHISLKKAETFESYAQVMAIWTHHKLSDEQGYETFFKVLHNLKNEIEINSNKTQFATDHNSLNDAWSNSKPPLILAVEDARILQNDLSKLDILYSKGVRLLTLNWYGDTCIGGAHNTNNGLTDFGVNVVKKHVKGNGQQAGSINEMEAPIHASNVMIIDPKTKKPTRIGHSVNKDGKKIRVTKKSNSSLD